MKTLDQIEARTPISSLPIIISTSGSYFFTGNLTFTAATGDAIDIGASDVTLDLNGFTLRSATAVTGAAISISGGLANITVKNGNIMSTTNVAIAGTPPSRTWTPTPGGFVRGIDDNSVGAHFMDLSIRGCRGQGIFSNSPGQAIIERVSCVSNGAFGIFAESGCLIGCTVRGNAVGGIIAPNGVLPTASPSTMAGTTSQRWVETSRIALLQAMPMMAWSKSNFRLSIHARRCSPSPPLRLTRSRTAAVTI
ncbi:MAG: hypothetical protein EAZ42_06815 [Verrucomicrobia bacterium]|nr:MAG: hypothetical protein EAZ42_06815 [Verrucomicrobiota bacterium]